MTFHFLTLLFAEVTTYLVQQIWNSKHPELSMNVFFPNCLLESMRLTTYLTIFPSHYLWKCSMMFCFL